MKQRKGMRLGTYNAEIPEILPVKSDFVFKLIFGDERNKDILAAFLNAVTKIPLADLRNLQLVNNELQQEYAGDKSGVLDVHVRLRDGKQIDIEVQVAPLLVMPERSLYYLAKMYAGQISKGESYFTLQKCIAINIVDFSCTSLDRIHTVFHFREDTQREYILSDQMEVHFLELPQLQKIERLQQEDEALINWLMFINAQSKGVLDVLASKGPELSKAADLLEAISRDEENRMLYEAREKFLKDEATRMEQARRNGEKIGRALTAKKMLERGMDISVISDVTGLSEEEVRTL